jgi:outer membrane receptor protein involved in Fe transport
MQRFQDLLLSSAAITIAMTSPAWAAPSADAVVAVKLDAGPLDKALFGLGDQARVKIFFSSELVAGKRATALDGRFTVRQALDHLLAGSGLEAQLARPGVIILRPSRTPISTAPRQAADRAVQAEPAAPARLAVTASAPQGVTELSEIVVGSHLRGTKDGPSPVLVLDRAAIDEGGYATVADALSAAPQTFGGTVSDDAGATGTDPTNTNVGRSSGVDLRGLGADATLVLINGRRMAGAGIMGDFADVSSIPLAAVSRIEVLLDGASALYGSDAVGGVVNIVMRDRYDGLETRARIGGSTRGDLGQRQLAQTFGTSWSTGSLLLSAEYQKRDLLWGVDRPYTASADLRGLGGTDHRTYFSQPGTVLGIDPATFSLVPTYAIPAGQDGTHLTAASFLPGQVNLGDWRKSIALLPSQERGSLYAAVSQDLGERVTLTADARYSDRRFTQIGLAPQTILTVTRNNPYYVSPTGSASQYIAYSFMNEVPGLRSTGEVQSRGVSIGAKVRLPGDWRLDAYALHAEELSTNLSTNTLNSVLLNEALGTSADNPATAFSAARDGYFNPFIGSGSNSKAVLDFVLSGWDMRRTVGRLDTASVTADGALWRLPAGAVQLAVGAQLRTEHLKTIGTTFTSTASPVPSFTRLGERTVDAVFAEARVPLFSDSFRRPGLERLELSAAVRREHYQGGATSTVPKLGVVWSPVSDWSLKGTYGESFRAPSLGQLTDPQRVTPVNISVGSTTVLTLLRYGGNPDLKPETARSWTAGLEFAPKDRPDVRVTATLFDTHFDHRIGQPAINNLSTVLTAPDLAPFRTFINPITNPADLATVQALLLQASAAAASAYPAEAYRAIAEARYVNTGSFLVRGLDLTGAYGLTIAGQPIRLNGNLSWLMSYKRKITSAAQATELAGTVENPADLRARLSASWTHGSLTSTVSLNHVGDLHTPDGVRIDSLTTADLAWAYAPRAQSGPWRNLVVSLTVQNVLDRDPPFYDSRVAVGYDPANYDPSGRVVALQLTKAW